MLRIAASVHCTRWYISANLPLILQYFTKVIKSLYNEGIIRYDYSDRKLVVSYSDLKICINEFDRLYMDSYKN